MSAHGFDLVWLRAFKSAKTVLLRLHSVIVLCVALGCAVVVCMHWGEKQCSLSLLYREGGTEPRGSCVYAIRCRTSSVPSAVIITTYPNALRTVRQILRAVLCCAGGISSLTRWGADGRSLERVRSVIGAVVGIARVFSIVCWGSVDCVEGG